MHALLIYTGKFRISPLYARGTYNREMLILVRRLLQGQNVSNKKQARCIITWVTHEFVGANEVL